MVGRRGGGREKLQEKHAKSKISLSEEATGKGTVFGLALPDGIMRWFTMLSAIFGFLIWGYLAFAFIPLKAQASSFYENPYITLSPDKSAWTVSESLPSGGTSAFWYPNGEIYSTGIASSIRELSEGEHYYKAERTGEIPVGVWKVTYRTALCIHGDSFYNSNLYGGISYSAKKCMKPYFSGWVPLCADCGEAIEGFMHYMSRDAVRTIQTIPSGLFYYYLCPSCSHLEQGRGGELHVCKAISNNRYQVRYLSNAPKQDATVFGSTPASFHMVHNACLFEGNEVTANTRLTLNGYGVVGYRFVGWNTAADGSGEVFEDGAEIYDLTLENFDAEAGTGIVTLYAQWERVKSLLSIDPAGGTYLGSKSVTTVEDYYGEIYRLDPGEIVAPNGFRVSFRTNTDAEISDRISTFSFAGWQLEVPAHGTLEGDKYTFLGGMGEKDIVRATYVQSSILLPDLSGDNQSFCGWYLDEACTEPAGLAGDEFTPTEDTILYAKWTELILYAENNWRANEGKGAVDLSWQQADGKEKSYLLYQSMDGVNFSQIYSAADGTSQTTKEKIFSYVGQEEVYEVPYTGFYLLTAAGAQGNSYGNHVGGKGGSVTGRFYLYCGEKITVRVGGSRGYGGGGSANRFAAGGGFTIVSSDRKGTLLIGGGGGGATCEMDGGAGGGEVGLRSANPSVSGVNGENGAAGGGGGYCGGKAGEYNLSTVSYNYGYHLSYHQWLASGIYAGCGWNKESENTYRFDLDCGWDDDEQDHGWNSYSISKSIATNGARYCEIYVGSGDASIYGYKNGKSYHLSQGKVDVSGYDGISLTVSAGLSLGGVGHETGYLSVSCFKLTWDKTEASYGGSSYVNTEYALHFQKEIGVRNGNGIASITAQTVGFATSLKEEGVAAPDLAAPDGVDVSTVLFESPGEKQLRLTWDKPKDYGTTYYHQAKSFELVSEQLLCASNVTKNLLCSGIKGYWYLVDGAEATSMSENKANAWKFVEKEELDIELTGMPQYLHLATCDRAGNLSETVHIRLDSVETAWKLRTQKVQVEEAQNVHYDESEDAWYVRADGTTPFSLSFTSRMEGNASARYQITEQYFSASAIGGDKQQTHATTLPSSLRPQEEERFDGGVTLQKSEGDEILGSGMKVAAVRSESGKRVDFLRNFTLSGSWNGEKIRIVPGAGAYLGEKLVLSDAAEDVANAVTLIADAEGPKITGMERLDDFEKIDRGSQELTLRISAVDDLSGVAEFNLFIQNEDNFSEETYIADETGEICVELTAEEALFTGNLTLTAQAVDRVGNVTTISKRLTEFALETELSRILEPHTPIFKCGESGILTIRIFGYATRLEVEFPESLTALNPDLNKVFVYDDPMYLVEESVQFMVPLYTPENEEYEIIVRAYKGDEVLEEHPTFHTIAVEGSVLEEIRTRLR